MPQITIKPKKSARNYAAQTKNIMDWEKAQELKAKLSDNKIVFLEGFVIGALLMLILCFIVLAFL